MPYCVLWDDADPEVDSTKIARSCYATLEEATAQAESDVERGKRVLGIEKVDRINHHDFNRGEMVWEPDGYPND